MSTPTNPPRQQRDPTQRRNRFRTLMGYTTRTWREDFGEVELQVREDHLNSMGIVHGGVYVTLLDAAFGMACAWCAVEGNVRSSVTVSLTTHFLASTTGPLLIGRGRVIGRQGRHATVEGEVVDGSGRRLITGQGSFLYMPGSEHRDGVARAT